MGTPARYRPPSAARLASRWLDEPGLVHAVRQLPAPVLGKLIDSIGLESAGELVALATTEQLERVFDEDLWHESAAGEDPRFDPARFALWLEVLLEAGEAAVVARLCELPEDFVTLCVERLILVLNVDRLGAELADAEQDEVDLVEKALDASLCEEWEEFRLIARDHRAWDSVLTALLALDREHHELLRRILERCCAASSEYIDDNGGLYEVLTSEEMLEADARATRDDRRAARGYVAASDAKSFLALARRGLGDSTERDPVTRAYFRELERTLDDVAAPPAGKRSAPAPRRGGVRSAKPVRLLTEVAASADASEAAGAMDAIPGTALAVGARETLLARGLRELAERDPRAHAERLEELGYLANVLVAGETYRGRRFRPIEALESAAHTCNAALEGAIDSPAGDESARASAAAAHLATVGLDLLFRAGWRARSE